MAILNARDVYTRRNEGVSICTAATFAVQDAVSKHLGTHYDVFMVVMIRYWFFAAFAIFLASRQPGGVRATARTEQPLLQTFRGLLLAAEVCVMVFAFVLLGLTETHAVFAAYPLIIAALSGPVLGESVGWRRWTAIGVGFIGVTIILQPGWGVWSPLAFIPLGCAFFFALYSLLTRYAARQDGAMTSFLWTGCAGAVAVTCVGLWRWEPIAREDWIWMASLCFTGVLGHWLLIKCYEVAEASDVQPFAYLQLPFTSFIGIMVFSEVLRPNVAAGAAIIVAAGVFTLLRARQVRAS